MNNAEGCFHVLWHRHTYVLGMFNEIIYLCLEETVNVVWLPAATEVNTEPDDACFPEFL